MRSEKIGYVPLPQWRWEHRLVGVLEVCDTMQRQRDHDKQLGLEVQIRQKLHSVSTWVTLRYSYYFSYGLLVTIQVKYVYGLGDVQYISRVSYYKANRYWRAFCNLDLVLSTPRICIAVAILGPAYSKISDQCLGMYIFEQNETYSWTGQCKSQHGHEGFLLQPRLRLLLLK